VLALGRRMAADPPRQLEATLRGPATPDA
jgi:hypothetical protein